MATAYRKVAKKRTTTAPLTGGMRVQRTVTPAKPITNPVTKPVTKPIKGKVYEPPVVKPKKLTK